MAEQLALNFEFRANQTFNDFFPGSNQDIIDHMKKCVVGDSEQQIFLWGKSGLGKSHLLQACCHYAHSKNHSSFYFSLSPSALPDPSLLIGLEEFDIVCFDNIDVIAGDAVWEQAFFNFFNQHRSHNNRLLVSAACAPHELDIQLADLKTRLNWGLALKIMPLTDDETIAALSFKAALMGFTISPQAGRFLLTQFGRDLTALWRVLETLDKASLAAKRKLSVPFLKEILTQLST